MSGVATKSPAGVGRPRVIDEVAVSKLVDLLAKGYSVRLSCIHAGISHTAYYDELARNQQFADTMHAAQDMMDQLAINNVHRYLNHGDLKASMWWLDRRDRQARNAQRASEHRDYKKILVTESHTETNGSQTVQELGTSKPPKTQHYCGSKHKRTVKLEKQM